MDANEAELAHHGHAVLLDQSLPSLSCSEPPGKHAEGQGAEFRVRGSLRDNRSDT